MSDDDDEDDFVDSTKATPVMPASRIPFVPTDAERKFHEAFKQQIGGDHYLQMAIQPFQFSAIRGYDGGAHSILKYLARAGAQVIERDPIQRATDWRKAGSFYKLRVAALEFMPRRSSAPPPRRLSRKLTAGIFCSQNKIDGQCATAIVLLDEWFLDKSDDSAKELARVLGVAEEFNG